MLLALASRIETDAVVHEALLGISWAYTSGYDRRFWSGPVVSCQNFGAQAAFALFELCVGIYFPCISTVKSHVVPDSVSGAVEVTSGQIS